MQPFEVGNFEVDGLNRTCNIELESTVTRAMTAAASAWDRHVTVPGPWQNHVLPVAGSSAGPIVSRRFELLGHGGPQGPTRIAGGQSKNN